LYENAITRSKNTNTILPVKELENQKNSVIVKMGDATNGSFISTLRKYAEVTEISDGNLDNLQLKLKSSQP
jgi:hypothetical protein